MLAGALARHDRTRPSNPAAAWLEQVRQGALILLYRLLFVLYAEDRDLLPDERGPYAAYSLTRMRREVAQSPDGGAHRLAPRGDLLGPAARHLRGHRPRRR